jgi:hypothetical protein
MPGGTAMFAFSAGGTTSQAFTAESRVAEIIKLCGLPLTYSN